MCWLYESKSESEVTQSYPTLATPWTVAYQAPLSMRFSRQEYWSGLPLLSPGDLPDPGIEPGSPALESDALTSEPPGKPRKRICKEIKSDINDIKYCGDSKIQSFH